VKRAGRLGSVALLVASLLTVELALRALVALPTGSATVARLRDLTSLTRGNEDLLWKIRFLERYERRRLKGESLTRREYEVDPELGWVPRANLRLTDRGDTYTTNTLGFRSLAEYVPDDDEHLTVLVLGDSFTYGIGASDEDVWPTMLQHLDERLRVLNMGVAGYGTDQMYLLLERHIDRFRPELVIVAYVTDDLFRSTLSFRDYQKPRFELAEGGLRLTNTPVPPVDVVAERLRGELRLLLPLSRSRLVGLVANARALLRPRQRAWREVVALNEAIVGAMLTMCRERGAGFLLLHLPSGAALADAAYEDPGELFLDRFTSATGARGLCPRRLLLQRDPASLRGQSGHYSGPAARTVARAVRREILALAGPSLPPPRQGSTLPGASPDDER
jgi:hypothetical protein